MPEIKVGLVRLCDRGHGQMVSAELVIDVHDRAAAHRCREPHCNRVYTELNGYRDLDGRNPATGHDAKDPRCFEHRYWMFACEELPIGKLRYVCPAPGCTQETTTGLKADAASA